MKKLIYAALTLSPLVTLAQAPSNFRELVNVFLRLIALLIPLIFLLSWFIFFWGLAKFIFKAGDTKSHEEGKALMKWGLIVIFVMLSFMIILSIFSRDIGFGPIGVPLLPTS